MNKTVLITGTSSGIGRATALYFQKKGWNVAATLRTPSKENELNKLENTIVLELDVTKPETIQKAIDETLKKFGKIDAVVNNAGYGMVGPFELSTSNQIKRQFETNVFGLMDVVQKILPYYRKIGSGLIINVSSMGGRLTFPIYSLYHSTKWAVEGFSESLQFELRPLNIRVKIVEPGAIKTDFLGRSADPTVNPAIKDYDNYTENMMVNYRKAEANGINPEKVAATIYKAANDSSKKLRYPVGMDSSALLVLRRFLPDSVYAFMIRSQLKGS
jgi:short-subunit dehydrogenase